MKAYNETWVDNLENQSLISNWQHRSLLSDEQANAARKLLPVPFYDPNIFLKVGLFIFTYIVIASSFGFLSVFIFSSIFDSPSGFAIVSLFYAVALGFFLEYFIKTKLLYRSGADNALLYAMLGAFFSFCFGISSFDLPAWLYCLIAIIILFPAMLRYGDPLVAAGVFANLLVLCYILLTKTSTGRIVLPFVMIAVSAMVHYVVNEWQQRSKTSYYADAQNVIKSISLVTLYLAGNYYVVREGNAIVNNLQGAVQIDFAFIFYAITAVLPIIYLYIGLKKHDRYFVIAGLLAMVLSVLTFLHYFSTWPGEWESTVGGAMLIVVSVISIRYLKTPRSGITSEPDDDENPETLQALLMSQMVQNASNQPGGVKFGDGNFGGGGSGSAY